MRRSQDIIEDLNYYRDARTQRVCEGQWYDDICERTMTATKELITHEDDDGEHVETFTFRFCYRVCGLCDGKGSTVSAGIDCGGLSDQDMWDDPDFASDYFGGTYDVSCPVCNGRRVEPMINDTALTDDQKRGLKIMEEDAQCARECHAERMSEMRMGC